MGQFGHVQERTLHLLVSHGLSVGSILVFGVKLRIIGAHGGLMTRAVNVRFAHRGRVMRQERIAIVAIVLGHGMIPRFSEGASKEDVMQRQEQKGMGMG